MTHGHLDVGRPQLVRSMLLAWYHERKRDLPWRRTSDPYAVWVSEVMLQQTQVATVVPYFERFLERFPTVDALATAAIDDVLAVWSGLGYYRRAQRLHAGAIAVRERFGGTMPRDADRLRSLPGIGAYTAGAISSIAFGREEPVVDGNVRRVLARLLGIRFEGDSNAKRDRALEPVARRLVEGPSPGDLNQALMELGATVCRPRRPLCEACPIASECRARRSGEPEGFPAPVARAASVTVRAAAAWIRSGEQVLIERGSERTPLRGVWDVPARVIDDALRPMDPLRAAIADVGSTRGVELRHAGRVRHGILNRRIELDIYVAETSELVSRASAADRATTPATFRFVPIGSLHEIPISGATQKVVRAILKA